MNFEASPAYVERFYSENVPIPTQSYVEIRSDGHPDIRTEERASVLFMRVCAAFDGCRRRA